MLLLIQLFVHLETFITLSTAVASPASGHVPPLAFERIFSLGYMLKQVVWFGLVLCQTLTQHYLFSRIRF